MGQLSSFMFISLNGYFKDLDNSTEWHKHGGEEAQFSEESLQSENKLIFGRITYEMMKSFWPTPMAAELFPKVSEGMNNARKIVFSKTINKSDWNNTIVINGDLFSEIKKLKKESGQNMTILGSGSIVSQLTEAGLIDTWQIMVDPVILNGGTPIFYGLQNSNTLKLHDSRVFKSSGVVLLTYVKV